MGNRLWVRICLLVLFFSTSFVAQSQINKDSLVLVMESTAVDSTKVKLLTKLSYLYALSDMKKSFAFANKAVEIAKEKKLKVELLEAYKAAGKICFDMGLMEDAAKYFNFCLELIYEKGNKFEMAMANLNIGAIWLYMDKNEKAEMYHLKSLELLKAYTKEKNDTILPPYVINIYNNLGLIYSNKGDVEKETFYINKGIALAEHNPDYAQTMVFLLHNKGDLLIKQSKYKEADTVLHKAIAMAEKLDFVGGLTPSYKLLGEMSEKKGNMEDALTNYKKGYTYAVASESNDLVQALADKLQIGYKNLGKTDSAFKYLNIAIATQNKIKIQEANDELLNKENKRKFEEWQKDAEKVNQSNYLKYWIIATITAILSVVFFVFYLRKRTQHQIVTQQKSLLESNIENKDKQLTNDSLYQIQKNEMIEDIVKKLTQQTSQPEEISKDALNELINDLQQTKDNNVWAEFEVRFKKVDAHFYDNLQVKYPELTRNERRLCAFLRLNMTTKEISAITGQSVKTLDVARTRLRKKLGIAYTDGGLVAFLNTI